VPYNFVADSFYTKKICSRFSSSDVRFYTENGRFMFFKLNFFSLGAAAETLRANVGSKSAISLQQGPVDSKFHVGGVAPTNHFSSKITTLNDLSYGIKIWTDLYSVLSQYTHLTDRILIARPRVHFMQRGNNALPI